MDPLMELYDQVALGEAKPPEDYNLYKRMLARASRARRSEDEQERLNAVIVAGAIGGFRGMDTVRHFTADPSLTVRKRAVKAAVDAGEDGFLVLRPMLVDPDPVLLLDVLGWLRRALDRGATSRLRGLLGHGVPEVRAAAAEFLGQIAGGGMVVPLRGLAEDEDEGVRAAAAEAVQRLDGELPRAEPDPWWEVPLVATDWAPPARLPLPAPLPEEPADLLRLLARVAEADQPAVVAALEAIGSRLVSQAVRSTAPDSDVDLNTGAALAGRLMGRSDWLVPVRRLLPDPDPGVRIAVAQMLGELGTPSVLMGVIDLLEAPELPVRLAAVRSVSQLASGAELERYLRVVADDPDETVKAAVATALAPPSAEGGG